ncbi:MAG: hypothetical protein MJ252_22410, partial [archaeon]|nr:hypothetical protein [archaeon]
FELLYFIQNNCGTKENGNEKLISMIIDFIDSTYENSNEEFKLKLLNDFEIHKKFGEFFFLFKGHNLKADILCALSSLIENSEYETQLRIIQDLKENDFISKVEKEIFKRNNDLGRKKNSLLEEMDYFYNTYYIQILGTVSQ